MTPEEVKEIRAVVLAALLDYEDLKKTRRIKSVKKAIRGTIAATALSSVGCIHEPSKESLITQRIIDYKTLTSNSQKASSFGTRADIANQIVTSKQISQSRTINGVVHFGFDSASIALAHKDRLEAFIEQLPKNAELTIIGLTDSSGDPKYNLELGKKRAIAVAKYLVSRGVTVKSFGSHSAYDSNGWMSRRVDIVVNYTAGANDQLAIYLPPLVKKFANRNTTPHNHYHMVKIIASNKPSSLIKTASIKANNPKSPTHNEMQNLSSQIENDLNSVEQSFDNHAKVSDSLLDTIR